jgi:hypothetical protein
MCRVHMLLIFCFVAGRASHRRHGDAARPAIPHLLWHVGVRGARGAHLWSPSRHPTSERFPLALRTTSRVPAAPPLSGCNKMLAWTSVAHPGRQAPSQWVARSYWCSCPFMCSGDGLVPRWMRQWRHCLGFLLACIFSGHCGGGRRVRRCLPLGCAQSATHRQRWSFREVLWFVLVVVALITIGGGRGGSRRCRRAAHLTCASMLGALKYQVKAMPIDRCRQWGVVLFLKGVVWCFYATVWGPPGKNSIPSMPTCEFWMSDDK